MNIAHACGKLFELLFPRPTRIAVFDTISADKLMRIASSTWVECEISCIAPLPYAHTLVRDAIHATKYHGHMRASQLLGEVLAPTIAEVIADKRMFGTYHTPILIPIPLHPVRMRERGFNQTERIAQAMLQALQDKKTNLVSHALIRVKNTPRQARQTSRMVRLQNISGAFMVQNPENVRGRDIILLDDVVTTGATMHTAKTALMEAGAREVLCVAVAH